MQHIGVDDVFVDSENVIKSDDRDHEGVVDSKSVDTNISMRSSLKSRTNVRGTDVEPSRTTNVRGTCLLTNVRGTDGPGGVGDAVLGTVWSGVSGSSNVRGLLDEMRLRYKSRRSSSSTSRRSSRTISTPPLMGTRRSSTGRVTRSMKKQRSAAFSMGLSELISYAGPWGSGDQEPFKEGAKLDLWQPNTALGTKHSVPSQSWQMRSGDGSQ